MLRNYHADVCKIVIFSMIMASKHKKECYHCDRSHHFTRNYVMEIVEATDTYGHTRTQANIYGHIWTQTDKH